MNLGTVVRVFEIRHATHRLIHSENLALCTFNSAVAPAVASVVLTFTFTRATLFVT